MTHATVSTKGLALLVALVITAEAWCTANAGKTDGVQLTLHNIGTATARTLSVRIKARGAAPERTSQLNLLGGPVLAVTRSDRARLRRHAAFSAFLIRILTFLI